METGKTPTELGYVLLQLMAEVNIRAYRMARLAGLGGSTLGRIIYGEVENPDPATLDRIAQTLATLRLQNTGVPGSEAALAAEAGKLRGQLMAAAGYQLGDAPRPRKMHPISVRIDRLVGEGSQLSDSEIRFLEEMVDRLIAPYERKTRKRTS